MTGECKTLQAYKLRLFTVHVSQNTYICMYMCVLSMACHILHSTCHARVMPTRFQPICFKLNDPVPTRHLCSAGVECMHGRGACIYILSPY